MRLWQNLGLVATLLGLLATAGCDSEQDAPPSLESLQGLLSVTLPDDARLIGGRESPQAASLWLIESSDPLPLPTDNQAAARRRSSRDKRPAGTPFPVSALINLIAACEVPAEDFPRLTEDRGTTHVGEVQSRQFCYREAPTERGWMTAIEIHAAVSAVSAD